MTCKSMHLSRFKDCDMRLFRNLRSSAILEIHRVEFFREANDRSQRKSSQNEIAGAITSAPADTRNQFRGCWYIF